MIPFSPPRIDDKTIEAVVETLKSGWITTGPKVQALEQNLAAFLGLPKTLCINSATAGMELLLRWFGVGPGDEVIIPAYTYCSTANVVMHCGAKPVMVDSGPDYNVSVDAIKAKINKKTKAIIPVDIGGFPADYNAIMALAKEYSSVFEAKTEMQELMGRVLVMSDAAHSLGATYMGSSAAQFTDVSVFSFHAVKNLTTAEGGAIAFNLPPGFDVNSVYNYLRTLSLHGQNKDALAKFTTGGWKYDVIEAGYKCNMPDILAAIGLVELDRYPETLNKRKALANAYNVLLSNTEQFGIPSFKTDQKESSYHLYMLSLLQKTENERNAIITELANNGVSSNVHFQPLPLLTYYKKCGYKMEDYIMAYQLYTQELSLPLYYDLDITHVEKICRLLISIA